VTVKTAQNSIEELIALRPTQPQQHDRYDFSHAKRQSSLEFKYAKSDDDVWELVLKSKKPGYWHNSMRDAIATMVGRGWPDDAGAMGALADAGGEAVADETSLEDRLCHRARRIMHDASRNGAAETIRFFGSFTSKTT
jgi:hypothetical protein